jgi:hypothetical protein
MSFTDEHVGIYSKDYLLHFSTKARLILLGKIMTVDCLIPILPYGEESCP